MTILSKYKADYIILYFITTKESDELLAHKCGVTHLLYNRFSVYITSNINRPIFIKAYKIYLNGKYWRKFDEDFKEYFKDYNIYINSGTEFYKNELLELVEEYLNNNNYNYDILDDIIRELNNLNITNKFKDKIEDNEINIQLKELQFIALKKLYDYFIINNFNKGQLIHPCGLGKTIEALYSIYLCDFKNNYISVPIICLLEQWIKEIAKYYLDNSNIIIISDDKNLKENIYKLKDEIYKYKNININIRFFNKFNSLYLDNSEYQFILSTYHSTKNIIVDDFIFDYKIADEAHHLVLTKDINEDDYIDKVNFQNWFNIKSKKELYITATQKFSTKNNNNELGMNNIDKFGEIIDNISIGTAITHKYISDYELLIQGNELEKIHNIISEYGIKKQFLEKKFNKTFKNNEFYQLSINAICALKAIIEENRKYILIYTNTIINSKIVHCIINYLLNNNEFIQIKDILNNKYLISDYNNNYNNYSYNNLIKDKSEYKIITSVYKIGEGFDDKRIDTVILGENMVSDIRITQAGLRGNRLKDNINDKALIILPYIDFMNNEEYKTIKNVISIFSNEDEYIIQKIKFKSLKEKIPKNKVENPNINQNIENTIQNIRNTIFKYIKLESVQFKNKFIDENKIKYLDLQNKLKKLKIDNFYEYKKYMNENINHNLYSFDEIDEFKSSSENQNQYTLYDILFNRNINSYILSKESFEDFMKDKNYENYEYLTSIFKNIPLKYISYYGIRFNDKRTKRSR